MPFIPQTEKSFPHNEGDLLLSFNEKEKAFYITKVLKIEKVLMKKGDIKNIAGHRIQAPEEDFFLIVAVKWTDAVYADAAKARAAAAQGELPWKYLHIPMRPSGLLAENKEMIGHQPVTSEELTLNYDWKNLFDKGEAGVW